MTSAFRSQLCCGLELEARAELHLEGRAALQVVEDVIAAGVFDLQKVCIGWRSEAAVEGGAARAVVASRIREFEVLQVEQVEELSRKDQPPVFAQADPFLHA